MSIPKLFLLAIFSFNFILSKAVIRDTTPEPGIKKVWIYGNTVNPSSVVIILSGDGGWVLGVVQVAKALAKENAMVIGVSSMPYIRHLRKQNVECYPLAVDIENLSKYIQTKYHLPTYLRPIILGYSLGATLAYGILAQAPANTFMGAISLGFCSDLDLPKPLCKGAGLECHKLKKNGFDLLPAPHLKDPFILLQGANDRICKFCLAKDFINKSSGSEIIEMSNIRHGSLGLKKWVPKLLEAYKKVIRTPHLQVSFTI